MWLEYEVAYYISYIRVDTDRRVREEAAQIFQLHDNTIPNNSNIYLAKLTL